MKWIKRIFGLASSPAPELLQPKPLAGNQASGEHWSEIVKRNDARERPSSPAKSATAPVQPSVSVSPLLGVQAQVGGKPTYELAASGKHDIEAMRECCEAEATNYWRQPEGERMCAAPYYFTRLAILHRKAKNYAAEIEACESWKAIINDYKRQPMVKARRAALAHKGSDSVAMLARIPKAKELLRKQKAAGKSAARK